MNTREFLPRTTREHIHTADNVQCMCEVLYPGNGGLALSALSA